MEFILLIVQLIVAVALIAFVLLQRSDNDGFGMGSGSGGGLMSSRGQANFMTKATAILAFIFMANSLVLTILTTYDDSTSIIDEIEAQDPFAVPVDGKVIRKDAVPESEVKDQVTPELNLTGENKEAPSPEELSTQDELDNVVRTLKEQAGTPIEDENATDNTDALQTPITQ